MQWRTLSPSLLRPCIVFSFCVCIAAFVIISHAWVSEEMYITFRVIDNFAHGYGLRWNTDERVQVYTHPLWMLIHLVLRTFFSDLYRLNIVLSALCCAAAIALMCRATSSSLWHKIACILVPLALSHTFRDFAMSGLENPLNFVLLAWFIREYFLPENAFRFHRLLLAAVLCVLTRFDNAVFLAVPLVWAAFRALPQIEWKKSILAALPLVAWIAFCLIYYGFIFPNTKYAKLNHDIPPELLIRHGFHYVEQFMYFDPVGTGLLGLALALGFMKSSGEKIRALALGIALHIAYVIVIGGDMMSGRFMVNMLIPAAMMVHYYLRNSGVLQLRLICLAVLALSALEYVLEPSIPYSYKKQFKYGAIFYNDHINDAYKQYRSSTGLFSDRQSFLRDEPTHSWVKKGKRFSEQSATTKVRISWTQGMVGFYSGPNVILIDSMGITDPLIARLPANTRKMWRAGHYKRDIPQGYQYFRDTGDLSRMDATLAKYEQKLWLVTSGELWSMERLKAIMGFQLGQYDKWRDEYMQDQP